MVNSNELAKSRSLSKIGKQFIQWKQEKLWSFDTVNSVLIEKKNRDMGIFS